MPLAVDAIKLWKEKRMERVFILGGALSAFLGVGAGAFGAHALRGRLAPRAFEVYEVAVRYQLIHALALLAVAWIVGRSPGSWARSSGWLFLLGIALFSGSLYLVSLTGMSWAGAVTPLGGTAFLAGWACLGVAGWKMPST